MAEATFGRERTKLGIEVEHAGMVAGLEQGDEPFIGGAVLGAAQVNRIGRLVFA